MNLLADPYSANIFFFSLHNNEYVINGAVFPWYSRHLEAKQSKTESLWVSLV